MEPFGKLLAELLGEVRQRVRLQPADVPAQEQQRTGRGGPGLAVGGGLYLFDQRFTAG